MFWRSPSAGFIGKSRQGLVDRLILAWQQRPGGEPPVWFLFAGVWSSRYSGVGCLSASLLPTQQRSLRCTGAAPGRFASRLHNGTW